MKKTILVLLLMAPIMVLVLMGCGDNRQTPTAVKPGVPDKNSEALVIKQPVQATLELGTTIKEKASILWVEDSNGNKAKVYEPIEEAVSIDTPQDEDSDRGVAANINLPDNTKVRTYLVCIKNNAGTHGSIHRIFIDRHGTLWQDEEKGLDVRFGKSGMAYMLVTINPAEFGLDGCSVTQTTQTRLVKGGVAK